MFLIASDFNLSSNCLRQMLCAGIPGRQKRTPWRPTTAVTSRTMAALLCACRGSAASCGWGAPGRASGVGPICFGANFLAAPSPSACWVPRSRPGRTVGSGNKRAPTATCAGGTLVERHVGLTATCAKSHVSASCFRQVPVSPRSAGWRSAGQRRPRMSRVQRCRPHGCVASRAANPWRKQDRPT
jgi:hypothetical protein